MMCYGAFPGPLHRTPAKQAMSKVYAKRRAMKNRPVAAPRSAHRRMPRYLVSQHASPFLAGWPLSAGRLNMFVGNGRAFCTGEHKSPGRAALACCSEGHALQDNCAPTSKGWHQDRHFWRDQHKSQNLKNVPACLLIVAPSSPLQGSLIRQADSPISALESAKLLALGRSEQAAHSVICRCLHVHTERG